MLQMTKQFPILGDNSEKYDKLVQRFCLSTVWGQLEESIDDKWQYFFCVRPST